MEFIEFNIVNHVGVLTLNRPQKRNAMNVGMIKEILQVLQACASDEQIKVLLIQGNGEHFCAGADIKNMEEMAGASSDENYFDAQRLADMMYRIHSFPKPTVILAHGATMGGGLGLLAACDIAVAATNATFAFSEVKIGLAPSTISPYVINAIGERAAHYYFLTAEKFDAQEAHRIGLIHRIAKDESLQKVGEQIIAQLLQNGPAAMTAVKGLIQYVAKEKITVSLGQKTAEHLADLRATTEAQEGFKAFLEKRKPRWSDDISETG